jgi:hypothetical protein
MFKQVFPVGIKVITILELNYSLWRLLLEWIEKQSLQRETLLLRGMVVRQRGNLEPRLMNILKREYPVLTS